MVYFPDTQKNNLLAQDVYQRVGVMAFIAYAFPAIFDMTYFSYFRLRLDDVSAALADALQDRINVVANVAQGGQSVDSAWTAFVLLGNAEVSVSKVLPSVNSKKYVGGTVENIVRVGQIEVPA